MNELYPQALQTLGWLLEAIENWLERQPSGRIVSHTDLRWASPKRLASDDEITLAIAALDELHILTPEGDAWRFDGVQLQSSAGYRRGVRDTLQLFGNRTETARVDLLVALPPSVDASMRDVLLREGYDLRSALVDLIASSRQRIVLASPFWDKATTDDLRPLLHRRISAGIQVDLLGRSLDSRTPHGAILTHLADELGAVGCRAFAWQRKSATDRFGSETFHLKVAVADDGERAYLGTANFTTASLRSRMELGIMTRGPLARSLAHITDAMIARARQR